VQCLKIATADPGPIAVQDNSFEGLQLFSWHATEVVLGKDTGTTQWLWQLFNTQIGEQNIHLQVV